MWKMYKMVKRFTKSSTKRNRHYLKGVYIELSQGPHSSQDYQERGNEILSRMVECMDHENKENAKIFVTYPVCFMLCSYDSVCKTWNH